MKTALNFALTSMILLATATMPACKTNEPGVKSTYRSQYVTVAGDAVKVTDAAKDVLQDLKLQNIDSKSTAVDGYANGMTANNTRVTVTVKSAANNVSEVTVNVGALGDPAMGKDIIARIQKKLGS